MLRRHLLAAAAAVATLGVPAIAKPGDAVRLGQSAPLAGAAGTTGRQFRDAAQAWFTTAAREGTLGGHRVEIVSLDDGGQVERALTNSKLLASSHGAVGLFGFVGAGANREGMQAALEEGLPFVAPVSGMDALRQRGNAHVYLLRAGHRDEIRQIIRHTASIGIARLGLLYEYDSAGWEIRDSFAEAAQDATLVHVGASVSRASADVAAALPVLLARELQAIVLAANPAASAALVRAARKAGFGGSFYTLSTVGGKALFDALGPLAVGISVAQVVPFPWGGSTPIAREFLAFCGAARIEPDFASMEGYVAARWLGEAVRRAKPKELTAATLAAALDRMPPMQLGGFPLAFSPETRSASAFVELTVVGSAMRFIK
jgi:branched-chain amino acid transport system substrate-binding protein